MVVEISGDSSEKMRLERAIEDIFSQGGDLEAFIRVFEKARGMKRQAKEEAVSALLEAFRSGDDMHDAVLKAKSILAVASLEADGLIVDAYAAAVSLSVGQAEDEEEFFFLDPEWRRSVART